MSGFEKDYLSYDFDIAFEDSVALVAFTDSHRHNLWSMPRMAQLTRKPLKKYYARPDVVEMNLKMLIYPHVNCASSVHFA